MSNMLYNFVMGKRRRVFLADITKEDHLRIKLLADTLEVPMYRIVNLVLELGLEQIGKDGSMESLADLFKVKPKKPKKAEKSEKVE